MSKCVSTFRGQIKLYAVVKKSEVVVCVTNDLMEDYTQFDSLQDN